MKHFKSALLCLSLSLGLVSIGFAGSMHNKDIVATAAAAGSFNTLITAVEAAELVDTLKGEGPLTVFAPTDEAFARLPAGTLEYLLEPENKEKLIAILTYHVVPGRVTAEDIASMTAAKTVSGLEVQIAAEDGSVRVDKARVTSADIMASNGVIHVVDTVMLPY